MNCPYADLPQTSWWTYATNTMDGKNINPHLPQRLKIRKDMKVATAGSCFAQHITKALLENDFNYFVTETAPPFLSTEDIKKYDYGTFSARYGNIYTPAQLEQLLLRCIGKFQPFEQFWQDPEQKWFDLLRPRTNSDGYNSKQEAEADCLYHLRAVLRLFSEADVFIFTLGLTEAWISKTDGTVFPTCPGCGSAGEFESEKYQFKNFSVTETITHLSNAIDLIKEINKDIEIIITVSPVPLVATASDQHVVQANTYSKAVLRVAAEEICKKYDFASYFASYEIILASGQNFFEADRRTVSKTGIATAMAAFMAVYCEDQSVLSTTTKDNIPSQNDPLTGEAVHCDEDNFYRSMSQWKSLPGQKS